MLRLLPLLVLSTLLAAGEAPLPRPRPADWAVPMVGALAGNFHQVDATLYRSAQPSAEAMRQIAALGVRTVLNLRAWHDDADEAKGTALKRIDLPLDAGALDEAGLVRALRAIRAADKPVLVHCWHGADRTGAVIAAWRVLEQGWTPARASDEMLQGGYGHHAGAFPDIERLVQGLDRERLRALVDASP